MLICEINKSFYKINEHSRIKNKIDKIDAEILHLLDDRMEFVHEIGKLKNASNESVYRPEREKEIIERLNAIAKAQIEK